MKLSVQIVQICSSSSSESMQYNILGENNGDSVVENTFTKHQSVQVHINVQVTEDSQYRHYNINVIVINTLLCQHRHYNINVIINVINTLLCQLINNESMVSRDNKIKQIY